MSAFSVGISDIYTMTNEVADLCRTLLELNADASALERLEGLGQVIEEMCVILEGWLGRTNSGALRKTLMNIKLELQDIQKLGTKFRVVASLTAINASSGAGEMDDFIEELRAVPEQIGTAVTALMQRLAKVDLVVHEAVVTARAGLTAMGRARNILMAHSEDSQAVFAQIVQSRQAMEMIGNRYLTQSQEQTKALVQGFQYSDFFAQRLEHVAQMLAREPELGPEVRLLAARQLAALASQGRDTVGRILAALQAQSASTDQFNSDFSDQGRRGAAGNAGLQGIFAEVLVSREKALPVIAGSVTSSGLVLEEIRLCHESFATLVEMSDVMDLAAINARLGAAREEKSRAAMSFLSDAVIEGAKSCRDALGKSSDGLAQVAAVQDQDMLNQLVACVARFTAAFDLCQAGVATSQQRIKSLSDTLAAMSRLIGTSDGLLRTCQDTASDLAGIVALLEDFSRVLAADVPVPVHWPDLSVIYDSYTIQDERDIHDQLIGRAVSKAVPAGPVTLDDVFF